MLQSLSTIILILVLFSTATSQDLPVEDESPYANQTRQGKIGKMEIVRYREIIVPNDEYEWELRAWQSEKALGGWVPPKPKRYRVIARISLRFPLYQITIHWSDGGCKIFCVSPDLYDELNPGTEVEVPYNEFGPVGVRIKK